MGPQYVANSQPSQDKGDAIESQSHRFRSLRFVFAELSANVTSGYLRVARNALAGFMQLPGCVDPVANIRRLECRILSKQLWPLAFSHWLQLVLSKKSHMKSQWLWKSQPLSTKSTKTNSGRALRSVLNCDSALQWPLFQRGMLC